MSNDELVYDEILGAANQDEIVLKYKCPIPATHDKFSEAHYFLHRLMEEFHRPEPFRWNLNAFLQALRSVTLMLQSELEHEDGFKNWYSPWQKRMKEDELLKRFVEGRNIVVHKGMLQHRSKILAGMFRGSLIKVAFDLPITVNDWSEDVLRFAKEQITDPLDLIADDDQQLGVQRTWMVDDLGDGDEDVLILCHRAWARISRVVSSAHDFAGAKFPPIEEEVGAHDPRLVNILLDPSLPEE